MYAECPVVAVNSGGPLESIAEGITGFLRPQDPQQWAAAIETLVDDRKLREDMGRAGKQRVVDMFTLDAFSRTLDRHIDTLVRSSPSVDTESNMAPLTHTRNADTHDHNGSMQDDTAVRRTARLRSRRTAGRQ